MVCDRREVSACLIMLSAKQGSHWYHFYNVFGMTRPGIDPTPILTYRTRSGRSTTWAIAACLCMLMNQHYTFLKCELAGRGLRGAGCWATQTKHYRSSKISDQPISLYSPSQPLYVNKVPKASSAKTLIRLLGLRSLIWVFPGRTGHFVALAYGKLCTGSYSKEFSKWTQFHHHW